MVVHRDVNSGDGGRGPHTERRRSAVAAALILAAAGILTAWNSYQAAVWGGVQSIRFVEVNMLRIEAAEAAASAEASRAVDLAMFSAWASAYASQETALESFYRERFRPEFRPAFEEWVASEPVTSSDAAPSPFALPSYQVTEEARSKALADSAAAVFRQGQEANRLSDRYVLNAAILGTVLFLVGIAQPITIEPAKAVVLVVAGALLLVALYNSIVLPSL